MLSTLTGSVIANPLTLPAVLFCTAASVIFGLCIALIHMKTGKYNKNYAVTLALIPSLVQIVIMLVNGNIGTGMAVAGAFALVRFRSIAGSARDIGSIFFAMAMGLVTGMGYLFYGLLFLIIIGAAQLLLSRFGFGDGMSGARTLRIVIPEHLDYDGLFDDLFREYTNAAELDRVKTTNMGSLYELTYSVRLKSQSVPKAFIDSLRCRNGNLNIILGREQSVEEL
ncbi:MAG: DUF4956 domain-containing protein [Oscillospiraceae bacterium]|jgi:hypothetical protein|nr:DUF4956 domain-containing protein [Oscillospiraceae bacterium]